MGFLDNSGELFVDAILTDVGRDRLSKNDGSFFITRVRFADDEIDYRFFNQLTGSDSKDRKILDSPVFEAMTNEKLALKYPLTTARNSRLQYLPQMVANPSSVTLKEQVDSVGGGADITVSQQIARAQTILPAELIDVAYSIEVDNDLLFVSSETPTEITPYGTAKYIIPANPNTTSAVGGTELKFNVRVQTLTTEIFDVIAGVTVAKPRSITTTIKVTGQQSSFSALIPVTIVEFATS